MQQCQDQLQFHIETPNDKELARRFADRQKEASAKTKELSQFARDRLAKLAKECEGFEISPSTGIMSGCDQSGGDCPSCGQ